MIIISIICSYYMIVIIIITITTSCYYAVLQRHQLPLVDYFLVAIQYLIDRSDFFDHDSEYGQQRTNNDYWNIWIKR